MTNGLETHDRVYLEKLHLAAQVLLTAAEEPGLLNDVLEAELVLVRDEIERALLFQPDIHHHA